jgi:hypothetical protein
MKLFIPLLFAFSIISCGTNRPCCRFGHNIDRTKTLHLSDQSKKRTAFYRNELYTVYISQKKAVKKLKRHLKEPSATFGKQDSLDLSGLDLDSYAYVRELLAKQIDHNKASVIDRASGKKVLEISKRKYNYINGPKNGRVGIEYIDPEKKKVIASRVFWMS